MGVKRIFLLAFVLSMFLIISANDASAADKQFTIRANNTLSGANLSDHNFIFELQDPTNNNAVLQTKTSNESLISFDPITLDDQDATSHFYRIVIKDTGETGITYDKQAAYVRIVPKDNLLAYQKDNTYKYVNDGSGPHPYHATDEELQGQAYVEWNPETKTLTFFRDEEGKYAHGQIVDGKYYYTGFEAPNDRLRARRINPTWDENYEIKNNATEIVFRDAIRPEGELYDWFYQYRQLEKADILRFDSSRATSFIGFFGWCSKLKDIDVTYLDFSAAVAAAGINNAIFTNAFGGTLIEEFDFNNYEKMDFGTNRPMASMFDSSALRYLNTESLVHEGSSAEFARLYCLEKAVVGPDYSFYRSNVDGASKAEWLKVETGEIGRFTDLMSTAPGGVSYNPDSAGTYVRPICRLDHITFENKYAKPTTDGGAKNPNTADISIAVLAGLIASCIGLSAVFARKAHRR